MKPRHLTYDETIQVLLTEDRKKRRKLDKRIPLRQSCPQGLTESDLLKIFGIAGMRDFWQWMRGQTQSVCDGRQYHYNRHHDAYCKEDYRPGTEWYEPGHVRSDGFSWRCGYTGTGYYEDTECAGDPHGVVTYPSDVERYLLRLPVTD